MSATIAATRVSTSSRGANVVRLVEPGRGGDLERRAVDFVTIGARQRVDEPEPAGHGVRGKPVSEPVAQVTDGDRDVGIGHHVRDEPRAAAGVGNGGHRGLPDARDLDQGALDDGQVHALAADLDPIVVAAEHLEVPVVVEAAEVAGLEAATAGVGREGWVAPVTERDAGTGDDDRAELARFGDEAVVDDRDLLGGRRANRDNAAREPRAPVRYAEGDHAGLVRAVHREQPRVRKPALQTDEVRGMDRLATEPEAADLGHRRRRGGDHCAARAWGRARPW